MAVIEAVQTTTPDKIVLLPTSGLVWWPIFGFAVIYGATATFLPRQWARVSRLDDARPLG